MTTNLNGHWKEFYELFHITLGQLGKEKYSEGIIKEEEHRGTIESISSLFTQNGFNVTRNFQETFGMNFLNGTAFLNHHFVKLGWLTSWMNLISAVDHIPVFNLLEQHLNNTATNEVGLRLSVPMAYLEGEK